MRTRFALVLAALLTYVVLLGAAPERAAQPSLAEPALSPDGSEIAFVSGGDIWTVPASGGQAHLLVSHPATESRPLYSPDGKYLAFVSTRTGNGDIYVLELATGDLRRLTFDDGTEQLDAWSRDSRWVYFSSTSHDISGMNDIFRVRVEGGTPMEVTADRYVNEFGAAPAPDGTTLAFAARGISSGQWWRHGRSHLDETELWLRKEGSPATYQRLAPAGAKQLWPMWSADGRALFYMSDRNGQENIWRLPLGGEAAAVTRFTSGRVLWPSISANGKAIVFERNFGIWKLDTAGGNAGEVKIELRGAPASPPTEHRRIATDFEDLALSPDGKKVALIAHGEIFAASAKDGGDATRVTHTIARERQIEWSSDNHTIAYLSERGGRDHIYTYDFNTEQELQVTSGGNDEGSPHFSPDGKLLAFRRGLTDLVVYDVAGKKETVVAKGRFDRPGGSGRYDWSPDSKWIAYLEYGPRAYPNLQIVPVAGGEPRAVSFLANTFAGNVTFSRDGKFLLFQSTQRTEDGTIAAVYLTPHVPKYREDQFRDLFKEDRTPAPPTPRTEDRTPRADTPAAADAAKPQASDAARPAAAAKKEPPPKTEVVLEGIRNRVTFLPVGLDIGDFVVSPDGKWLGLIARSGGEANVYVYSIDELAKEPPVAKQLTSNATRKSSIQFSPDSKEIWYLTNGRISHVNIDNRQGQPLEVTAEMDVDFSAEKLEAFDEGWRALRDNFWDAKMNGLDWQAVHDEYAPHIAAARNGDELRRVTNLMIGELNSSHMGTSGPPNERVTSTGRLGLRFDRTAYEADGKFRVTEVIGLSPAAIAGMKVGETLTSIDGKPLDGHSNLEQILDYTIDKRITLGVADSAGTSRTVTLKPTRLTTEKGLLYRDWVNRNRDYVEKASGGKLGYVHMLDMGEGSLRQLFLDLDTGNVSKQGVIIDVRNNNGGFVNAMAIDVLARRGYMTMTPRNFGQPVPARSMLGQRSLELPTLLVTNQHSLSDAEDFTEGYRSLHLGKVVGEPTAGWIVYTGGVQLIDGTNLRMPGTRIRAHDGTDMEMHPRAVDIEVHRAVGESYKGIDTQLDVAVRELLNQVQGSPAAPQRTTGQ